MEGRPLLILIKMEALYDSLELQMITHSEPVVVFKIQKRKTTDNSLYNS